jgi:hypothetical protein
MSTQEPGPNDAPPGRPPTEEELAAAYEAELKRLRVEDVVLQTLVSLLNLGGRKAGLTPGTEDERDPEQLKLAIEGARLLLPLIEGQLGPDGAQLREAISQLQMAYVKIGGAPEGGPDGSGQAPPAGDQGPAKPADQPDAVSSGRLWVPGQ